MSEICYLNASVDDNDLRSEEAALDLKRINKMRNAILSFDSNHAPDTTVHLKGFTSGLADLTDEHLSEVLVIIEDLLKKHNIQKVVWDGDDYAEDSFTRVLPSLQKRRPDLKLVAFLSQGEKDKRWKNDRGFNGSWSGLLKELDVILVDNMIASGDRYERLGILALRATQAKLVIAIGGGVTLRREYDANIARDESAKFFLLNAIRCTKEALLPSSIYGLEDVEVENFPAVVGTKQHPWAGNGNMKMQRPRPLKMSVTILNFYGINELNQTFDVRLFLQMHWEVRDGDNDDWKPYLEWRNSDSIEEYDITYERQAGYNVRTSHVRATIFQPLNLRFFPFDIHKLEIILVSDEVCKISMAKLGKFGANFRKSSDDLMLNSQWKLLSCQSGRKAMTSFAPTPVEESATCKSYTRMSIRMCVVRKWQNIFFNFLLPVSLLSGLALTSYSILPPKESMEGRLAINFTLLLSIVATKITTVSMLPAVPYLTSLDKYVFLMTLFIIAVSVESFFRIYFLPNFMKEITESNPDHAVLDNDKIAFVIFAIMFIVANVFCVLHAYLRRQFYYKKTLNWMDEQVESEGRLGFYL